MPFNEFLLVWNKIKLNLMNYIDSIIIVVNGNIERFVDFSMNIFELQNNFIDHAKLREENLRLNQEFLNQLGIHEVSNSLSCH